MHRRSSLVLGVLALVAGVVVGPGAGPAHAATRNWSAGGVGDNTIWSDAANWNEGFAPAAGDDLVFTDGSEVKTANNDLGADFDVKSMSIASGYTIGGQSIDMIVGNTGITFNTGSTSVVNLPIEMLASATVTADPTVAGTIGGVVSGASRLTKAGTGTLVLGGNNNYTSGTTLSLGTLRLAAPGTIPDTGTVNIANAAATVFDLDGFSETIGTLTGGGATGGNISLGAGTLTVTQTADLSYAGAISGTGGLVKAGATRLRLSGTSTYTGATTINAGELAGLAGEVVPNGSVVTLADVAGATLTLGGTETIGGLAGGGATGGDVAAGANDFTINQTGNTTYAGEVSGTGTVTKSGVGTLTASGVWTHTGNTDVVGGRLDVTGTIGPVRLAGGTLGGTGTVGAVTSPGAGGTIAPGLTPGDLTTGNLTLNAATTLSLEINGTTAATQHDQLDVAGTVTLGNAALTTLFGFTPANGDAFTIIDNDDADAVTGTFAGLAEGATFVVGARQFRITYAGGTGNDVVITTEVGPTTAALTQSLGTTISGENVTFTTTISNPNGLGTTPSGTVTFLDGGAAIGTGALAGGQATLTTSALGVGNHAITATYAGDAAFAASAAAAINHTVNAVPAAPAPTTPAPSALAVVGYRLLDGVGGLHAFGAAAFLGSLPGREVMASAVDLEHVTDGALVLDTAGGVHAFGAAVFHGSLPGRDITVGGADIEAVPGGYFVLDRVGGVHAFGAAVFIDSLPGRGIPTDAVDLEVVDGGYYILDRVGGVHAFGAAVFIDSLSGRNVFANVVDLEATTGGYAVLDVAGGFHAFGGVAYQGSLPGLRDQGVLQGSVPVADLTMTNAAAGYYVLEHNGGVHAFNAPFLGSLPTADPSVPFLGLELLTG